MRLLSSLISFASLAVAAAIPTKTLPGTSIKLSEAQPWHITKFVVFEAQPHRNCSSYISFHFEDLNKGLRLNSTCTRSVDAGSNETLSDSGYQRCDSEFVYFVYDGEELKVEHFYKDPALGASPYDGAVAFGHAKLNTTLVQVDDGVLRVQSLVTVPITSLSS